MGEGFVAGYAIEFPDEVNGLLLAAPTISGVPFEAFGKEDLSAFEYDEAGSGDIAQAWFERRVYDALEMLRELWCRTLAGENLKLFREMVEQNRAEIFTEGSMQQVEKGRTYYALLNTIHAPTTVLVGTWTILHQCPSPD